MTSLSELDPALVEERLTPGRVRVFQIVYVMLVFGIMSFLVVLLFLFGMGGEAVRDESKESNLMMLTILVMALTLVCWVVATVVYRAHFSPKSLGKYATEPMRDRYRTIDDPAEKALMIVQRAMVLRAAILDVPAFSGLTICIVGLMNGVLFYRPEFLVNAAPAFVQLVFLALTFPTRDRILEIVRRDLLQRR